ncbi:MAG: D-alanyl-D-alanine carboxypeptidase [Actinomycetota bacterium]|nr:D-alanyl-D-alanine carboxypeptidase [Actinomycetota bacterium]
MTATAVRRAVVAGAALAAAILALPAGARAVSGPRLSASAAALVEESTGQRLYGQSSRTELAIASTTKLMTALIALEHVHRLSTEFIQNNYVPAPADSQIGLLPGQRMSVHDLLIALLLPSADDAAEDLAYNVGHQSVSRFVAMMNVRARQLGLKHTHYSTPIGLDTPGNFSTASDLVKLARYVLQAQPFFRRVVALPAASLRTGPVRYVLNRNTLVGRVPWINGVKTGHTLDAGYVLVGSGTRGGMTLISSVLGTTSESSRNSNTLALLSWGFANFHLLEPVRAGMVMAKPTVRYSPGKHATVVAASDFVHVFRKSSAVRVRVKVPSELAGPIARGARVGTAYVLERGRIVATVPLLLARGLPAVSVLTIAAEFLIRPATLLAVVLLLCAALGAVMLWRQRSRATVATPRAIR